MVSIIILADDLTGALDTGVQFVKNGIKVKVTSDYNCNFLLIDPDIKVLSINTETRHLSPEKAYERIYKITKKALRTGIEYIYKKTDSVLRGNIGSELSAVLDASEEDYLVFIPAYPKMNRTVKNGLMYIDGIPIGETIFSKDPFNEINSSNVANIVKQQCKMPVSHLKVDDKIEDLKLKLYEKNIMIYDSETDQDIRNIGSSLIGDYKIKLLAGCAGFASNIQQILQLKGDSINRYKKTNRILVACGSLNKTSIRQIEFAVNHGFQRYQLSNVVNHDEDYLKSDYGKEFIHKLVTKFNDEDNIVIDTFGDFYDNKIELSLIDEETRIGIAKNFGHIIKWILLNGRFETIIVTGGDILKGFMDSLNYHEIYPITEIVDGAVLFKMEYLDREFQVIAKSGGFGEDNAFVNITNAMSQGIS